LQSGSETQRVFAVQLGGGYALLQDNIVQANGQYLSDEEKRSMDYTREYATIDEAFNSQLILGPINYELPCRSCNGRYTQRREFDSSSFPNVIPIVNDIAGAPGFKWAHKKTEPLVIGCYAYYLVAVCWVSRSHCVATVRFETEVGAGNEEETKAAQNTWFFYDDMRDPYNTGEGSFEEITGPDDLPKGLSRRYSPRVWWFVNVGYINSERQLGRRFVDDVRLELESNDVVDYSAGRAQVCDLDRRRKRGRS